MTIGQLIDELQRMHSSATTVVVTWEGQRVEIEPDSLYMSADGEAVIDADGNAYRADIKRGRWSR